MRELITKKQPEIILKKEELLRGRHWLAIRNIYKMEHYTIVRDHKECIFVNSEAKGYERIVGILKKIFVCRLLNKETEKLFDELKVLTDEKTSDAALTMWIDWRKEVRKLELNEQAHTILKEARSNRLYYKSKKQREIINELFDIGFGLYEQEAKCDFQQGAENAFMYGYLMGMRANGTAAKMVM